MALLLVVIYITFISLGLPDSLFGVSWPLVHLEFGLDQGFGSFYSIVVALTTGGISFFAGSLVRKFGTGKVTAVSVLMTAISLLGIALSPNIVVMIIFSVIGGLGAGAIDTGLNNYVSLNYKAMHMNWLHCFWGVGVSVSPLIMAWFLQNGDWRGGYSVVSYIQFGITALVFLSLILWKKYDKPVLLSGEGIKEDKPKITFKGIVTTKGVICAVLALGFYCCMEFLLGTWGSSYLVSARGFGADRASLFVSLYYGGITASRFVAGLVSLKVSDNNVIRVGIAVSAVGIVVLFFPYDFCALISFLLLGVGFGPIFPSSLHAVPVRFGADKSADITGYMMGGAYAIGFLFQVAFGYTASATTFNITPFCLVGFCVLLFLLSEILNKITKALATTI